MCCLVGYARRSCSCPLTSLRTTPGLNPQLGRSKPSSFCAEKVLQTDKIAPIGVLMLLRRRYSPSMGFLNLTLEC